MKAVGYRNSLPIDQADSLLDVDLPDPVAGPRDLIVSVKAVSVNPVDTKVRMRAAAEPGRFKVLGFDAAGLVKAVGQDVTLFKPGDEVFYAGSIARPGTNSELHAVDERIAGPKPQSLNFAQAAALPLTSITCSSGLRRWWTQDTSAPRSQANSARSTLRTSSAPMP